MLTRTIEEGVVFNNPFKVPGLRKLIPPGAYRIDIMVEPMEGLGFVAYRQKTVELYIPTNAVNSPSKERSIFFEPKDFDALMLKDKLDLVRAIERAENEGMYIPT